MWTVQFYLEAALQTNGVIESDVEEVIKKQLDNAPKCKDDEKTQMMQIVGLIQPMRMGSCFGLPTFYIGFCNYQLHQHGSY